MAHAKDLFKQNIHYVKRDAWIWRNQVVVLYFIFILAQLHNDPPESSAHLGKWAHSQVLMLPESLEGIGSQGFSWLV